MVGISTLSGLVFFENGILVNDVGVASATNNVINSKNGDLIFEAESGTVQVNANLSVQNSVTADQLNVDQTRLNGNVLETTSGNNNLTLQAHGTGVVDVNDTLEVTGFKFNGDTEVYDSVVTTLNPASPPAAHDKLISARAVGVAIDGIDQILTVSADTGTNEGITLGTETLNFAGTANEIETTVSSNQIQIGLPNNVTIGNNLTVTNTLGADRLNVNELRIDDNIISNTVTDGNINLRPNGTGNVNVGTTQNNRDLNVFGNLTVNGTDNNFEHLEVDNIEIQDNTITTVNNNGNLVLDANGSGNVEVNANSLNVNNNFDVDGSTTLDATTVDDTLTVNGRINIDNLRLDGNTLSSTSGDITFDPTGSNNVVIGASSSTELICSGDIRAFDTSDRNLKENITPIPNALDKILSLSGNTFTWIKEWKRGGEEDIGVIAQEVEALGLPNITTTRTDGTKAVMYKKLIPVLIEAIKELKSEIEELKK